ncbi:PadR family transcriptional regulator [Roseateles puraquae]|jgi:DNA-binding PadR family transcriptional regulator|uniref:PadR family transcriptional regulator n=1 Tax=Roseateles puraquae TaxID=431059 RepID=UPI0031D4D3C9
MARSRAFSPQALRALAVLADAGADWRHGYDITALSGLKSGTLYPLLMRLEAAGQLEARWEESPIAGRPPRHVYRLTDAGVALVNSMADALAEVRALLTRVTPDDNADAAEPA